MIPNWDPATEKALVRKIDLRIFPVMIVLFILNFIDRNNFANARLSGLEKDLKLTDVQYQTCISVLLSGYVAMQIPSNMILNKLKRPSWWLFIVEGAVTVALAGVALFILPDYPKTTSWLTEEERRVAQDRLALDEGLAGGSAEDEDVTALQGLVMACKDVKVWLLGLAYHATIMGLSFVFFFPTITQGLGYGQTVTLLLTAPPWMFAVLISLPNAWHADKTGERFFHYFGPLLTCIVGYIISATTTTTAPRYVSLFLMTVGFASGFVILAWISNTIPRPAAKKAAAIAMVNAMGNIGSIPGSYIWPAKYGPYYVESFGAEIALLGFAAIAALGLRFYLRAENKKLDREEAMQDSVEAGAKDFVGYDAMAEVKSFRYLY
ncbi:MFS transporter prlL [Colletotrichum sp. SAR 10_75]|nr:MFS transporter prlL [Colletotrichum sp. SAR 10_75]